MTCLICLIGCVVGFCFVFGCFDCGLLLAGW